MVSCEATNPHLWPWRILIKLDYLYLVSLRSCLLFKFLFKNDITIGIRHINQLNFKRILVEYIELVVIVEEHNEIVFTFILWLN